MVHNWQKVKLKKILTKSLALERPVPETIYNQVGIQLWGKGAYLREPIDGGNTGYKFFSKLRSGDVVVNKIWARNGATSVVFDEFDGCYVSTEFPVFKLDRSQVHPKWMFYATQQKWFWDACSDQSYGTSGKNRIKPEKFLEIEIPLPSLEEQVEVITKIEVIKSKLDQINILRREQTRDINNFIFSKYCDLIKDASWAPMKQIAPIVRRVIAIKDDALYPELGIRCFGKGTFHKPALTGTEVATKKIFQIKKGDLIFSNVFAWEGGIVVAGEDDNDRYGSHRFISCVADESKALVEFLRYHFLSPKGLEDINACSPGGAGRNKTLGLEKLMRIMVPIPSIESQKEFVALLERIVAIQEHQKESAGQLTEFMPGLLNKAFKLDLITGNNVAKQKESILNEKDLKHTNKFTGVNVIEDLELAMIVALIESKLGISYGEVGLQKTVFNMETFYPALQHKYDFVNYHYGTYSAELRDKLKANPLLVKKKVSGNEVYTISLEDKKLVLDAITGGEYPGLVDSVNKVLDIYAMPFINKATEKIELLNTVAKLMTDLKTDDPDLIYRAMKDWEIKQTHFHNKAEKYSKQDTLKTIALLRSLDLATLLTGQLTMQQ